MLLQQSHREKCGKLCKEETLVWAYRNANSEWSRANNSIEILINSCLCIANKNNFVKTLRSHIDYVSVQLLEANATNVININTNDINLISSLNCEEMDNNKVGNDLEILINIQMLLRRKHHLMTITRKTLTELNCKCILSTNHDIFCALERSEFNCVMWYRQIRLIEARMRCTQQMIPFDAIAIANQLLEEDNELIVNNVQDVDINNNPNCCSQEMTQENFTNDLNTAMTGSECAEDVYDGEYCGESCHESCHAIAYMDSTERADGGQCLAEPSEEIDSEVRTFQELHPIRTNVIVKRSAHDLPVIRSTEFARNSSDGTALDTPINHDLLPQITVVEIEQILNN